MDIWIPSEIGYVVSHRYRHFPPPCHYPVFERITGGGTVILSPSTLIVDVVVSSTHKDNTLQSVVEALNHTVGKRTFYIGKEWPDILHRPTHKKIGGTSFYHRKNITFISMSILLRRDIINIIERCLPYPDKAPLHRKNRSHKEFLISLEEITLFSLRDLVYTLISSLKSPLSYLPPT